MKIWLKLFGLLIILIGWLVLAAYRPGGIRNRHDWMSDHQHKLPDVGPPCVPDGLLLCIESKTSNFYLIEVQIPAENIYVKFDICLKHGELRPIK